MLLLVVRSMQYDVGTDTAVPDGWGSSALNLGITALLHRLKVSSAVSLRPV